jgi:hypothetical protein
MLQIACIQMPVIHNIDKVNQCKLFQTSLATSITFI